MCIYLPIFLTYKIVPLKRVVPAKVVQFEIDPLCNHNITDFSPSAWGDCSCPYQIRMRGGRWGTFEKTRLHITGHPGPEPAFFWTILYIKIYVGRYLHKNSYSYMIVIFVFEIWS